MGTFGVDLSQGGGQPVAVGDVGAQYQYAQSARCQELDRLCCSRAIRPRARYKCQVFSPSVGHPERYLPSKAAEASNKEVGRIIPESQRLWGGRNLVFH